MQANYKHKASSEAGKEPLPADVLEGEIVINLTDRALYTKDGNGEVIRLNSNAGFDITKIDSVDDILDSPSES